MPKKKFIDKKSAVSFRLVHRSQRDPLIATEAGEHVLAPIAEKRNEALLEEEHKYGIFYDDDYNYLQHLRDVNEVYSLEPLEDRFRITARQGLTVPSAKDLALSGLSIKDEWRTEDEEVAGTSSEILKNKLQVPSSVLGNTSLELKTGLLNQAAPFPGPHPEMDPDILAALDDDFDFENPENQILDDFVITANAKPEGEESEEEEASGSDDCASDGQMEECEKDFDQEETRSRFTAYSMTSSVIRRSEGLQRVDDHFEKLYEQYDEDELGDLGVEEDAIGGFIEPDSERIKSMLQEYADQLEEKREGVGKAFEGKDSEVIEMAKRKRKEEPMETILVQDEKKRERWDCQSILSTYSTLYNHPTLIMEPPGPSKKRKRKMVDLNPKTGLPTGVLDMKKGGDKVLAGLPGEDQSMDVESVGGSKRSQASTCRAKGETSAERRMRKKMVKEERKERRIEKKANKLAFKDEEARQVIQSLNQKQMSGVVLV